jgi:GWxTD domain-containing protein
LNTQYWYNSSSPVKVDSRVSAYYDQLKIFLNISGSDYDEYALEVLAQKDFETEQHRILNEIQIDTLRNSVSSLLLEMNFEQIKEDLLVLKFSEGSQEFYFPIQLKRGGYSFPPFYPIDQNGAPIVSNFTNEQVVRFTHFEGNPGEIYAYKYLENFNPADPPMGIVQTINPNLEVQGLFTSQNLTFTLQEKCFYFIQNDTLSNYGLTLYGGNNFFPEYKTIPELIPPLTYVSRPSELSEMLLSERPKATFDKYWLRLYSTEGAAKAAIRGYYSKIFKANKLFTDYKQGWKTDRGIIFIVFGVPSRVFRRNFMEVWQYEDGTTFEFRILSNLFAPNLYVLIRNENYRETWISKIKELRGGN